MLKIISSKNESEIYNLARKDPFFAKATKDKKEKFFLIDCDIDEAITNAENISIFGDLNAFLIRISGAEDLEKINKELLEGLEKSVHFFVIVGNGADFEKKINSTEFKLQKIVEKVTFDFPADLVTALQKHDKKNSWGLLLKELSKKDAEPIHGTCVFAYKSLLVCVNDPKKNSPNSGVKEFSWNSAKRNAIAGKREREEVVNKYFNLIYAYHEARNGKLDLASQLEKWVLEN